MQATPKIVVIGGSWGGIQASLTILGALPENYSIPVVLVLHRLRTVDGSLQEVLNKKLRLNALEIEDKEKLRPGNVYLAPANYHVLLEKDLTFSLDDSELENYSRPSIDVTFTSVADAVGERTVGILLSGASKDGSTGLKDIFDSGGKAVVQDPAEAEVDTMPLSAIELIGGCSIMSLEHIKAFLLSLHDH